MILDQLADEEMAALHVFHLPVVLRVVGHIDGRLIVQVEVRGLAAADL